MSANEVSRDFAMKVARNRIVGMLDQMIELRSRAEMMIVDFLGRVVTYQKSVQVFLCSSKTTNDH